MKQKGNFLLILNIFWANKSKLGLTQSYPLTIYKTLDLNKDGHISMMEMKKSKHDLDILIQHRNSSEKIDAETVFKDLDKNNNGKIEPKEIDESLEDVTPFLQRKMSKNNKKMFLVNIDN